MNADFPDPLLVFLGRVGGKQRGMRLLFYRYRYGYGYSVFWLTVSLDTPVEPALGCHQELPNSVLLHRNALDLVADRTTGARVWGEAKALAYNEESIGGLKIYVKIWLFLHIGYI